MQTPQDNFIQIGPIKTRYWAEGSGEHAVILLHGWYCFVEYWLPSFAVLAQQHRVYALDLPGHGQTDKPSSFSYHAPDFARFIREFMTALNIKRASLMGHSFGGAVLLHFALQFPDVVDRLILVDSAGLGKAFPFLLRLSSAPMLGDILSNRPTRATMTLGQRLQVVNPAFLTKEWLDIVYRMAIRPGQARSLLRTLRGMCNVFGQHQRFVEPIISGLRSIQHPTQIIWGRQDHIVPATHAQVAAQGIPHARLHIFEQCGHRPMLEQTQSFNKTVLEFLDN